MDSLYMRMIFPGISKQPEVLRQCLAALESDPIVAPTHASVDERKRLPYDRDARVAEVTKERGREGLLLWRAKAPKYEGGIISSLNDVNVCKLEFPKPGRRAQQVFDSASALANAWTPELGFVHVRIVQPPESQFYNEGTLITTSALARFGLSHVYARTWFGTYLISRIGRDFLLSLPNTIELPWGGIQLDLVPEPWNADFETLSKRQLEVMDALRPFGVIGDYSKPFERNWKPDPRWVPPPWEVGW